MLANIAWRNIWRNRRRSWAAVAAVSLGISAYVFGAAVMEGSSRQLEQTLVERQFSHIQVAARQRADGGDALEPISGVDEVQRALGAIDGARSAPAIHVHGMASRAERSMGIAIVGFDPRAGGSTLPGALMAAGRGMSEAGSGDLVVSADVAERLRLEAGDIIVLTVTDVAGDIASSALRVSDVLENRMMQAGRPAVFITLDDARRITGLEEGFSFIAVSIDDPRRTSEAIEELRGSLDRQRYDIRSWQHESHAIAAQLQGRNAAAYGLAILIAVGVSLVLITFLLPATYERGDEHDAMLLQGAKLSYVRFLVMVEGCFILVIGLAIGLGIAALATAYFGETGLQFDLASADPSSAGTQSFIPRVDPGSTARGLLLIGLTCMGSLMILIMRINQRSAVGITYDV